MLGKIFLCMNILIILTYSQIRNEKDFYKYFQKIGEVKLSGKPVINDITSLDYANNQLLITDASGKQVVLFNAKTGKLNCILDVELTTPGFNWLPYGAYFNKEGIFVANSGPWGYRFFEDGKGRGMMSTKFAGAQCYVFLSNGNIVGWQFRNDIYLSLMTNTGEEIKRSDKIFFNYPNITYRFMGNDMILDENDYVYLITCADWLIYKYDKNLNFIKKINTKPTYFRKIDRDFKSKDPAEALMDMKGVVKDKSTNMNMFYLSKNKILIQYYTAAIKDTPIGISIIDAEGNKLLEKDILIDKHIIKAKENKIYFYNQPKWDNVNQPGPVIEIYELKSNSLKKN